MVRKPEHKKQQTDNIGRKVMFVQQIFQKIRKEHTVIQAFYTF